MSCLFICVSDTSTVKTLLLLGGTIFQGETAMWSLDFVYSHGRLLRCDHLCSKAFKRIK